MDAITLPLSDVSSYMQSHDKAWSKKKTLEEKVVLAVVVIFFTVVAMGSIFGGISVIKHSYSPLKSGNFYCFKSSDILRRNPIRPYSESDFILSCVFGSLLTAFGIFLLVQSIRIVYASVFSKDEA